MLVPNEVIYMIAEKSDDYITTLKQFGINPGINDYKYLFRNVLKQIKTIGIGKCVICAHKELDIKRKKYRAKCIDIFYPKREVSLYCYNCNVFKLPNEIYIESEKLYTYRITCFNNGIKMVELIKEDKVLITKYILHYSKDEYLYDYENYEEAYESCTVYHRNYQERSFKTVIYMKTIDTRYNISSIYKNNPGYVF